MKIEDKSYFAEIITVIKNNSPTPKFKVGDTVSAQGQGYGKITESRVDEFHGRMYVTYTVKLQGSNGNVEFDEKELTKINAKPSENSPYKPTGRQGIYSKDYPVEDKRYFADYAKMENDIRQRFLKELARLELIAIEKGIHKQFAEEIANRKEDAKHMPMPQNDPSGKATANQRFLTEDISNLRQQITKVKKGKFAVAQSELVFGEKESKRVVLVLNKAIDASEVDYDSAVKLLAQASSMINSYSNAKGTLLVAAKTMYKNVAAAIEKSKSLHSRAGSKSKFRNETEIKIKGKTDKIYGILYQELNWQGKPFNDIWTAAVKNYNVPNTMDILVVGQYPSKEQAKAAAIKALKMEEEGKNMWMKKDKFASMWTDGSVREAEYYKKIMKQLLAAIDAKSNSLKANKQTVSQAYAMVETAISQKNASMLDEAFNNYDRANYAARNSFGHKGTKSKFAKYVIKNENGVIVGEGVTRDAAISNASFKTRESAMKTRDYAKMLSETKVGSKISGGVWHVYKTENSKKFSTRGAFAEASSSPMLGELLQKKVMPEGGWRAVETGSGAITIAFEDPDIAENFAKRCAENGYSATRPAITAARYFNVCVSEEGKKNETK